MQVPITKLSYITPENKATLHERNKMMKFNLMMMGYGMYSSTMYT